MEKAEIKGLLKWGDNKHRPLILFDESPILTKHIRVTRSLLNEIASMISDGIPYKEDELTEKQFCISHWEQIKAIVAYKTATKQTVNLVLDTIHLAMKKEKKRVAAELQLHSDQGFQYTSQAYYNQTQSYGITPSMSRRGTADPHRYVPGGWTGPAPGERCRSEWTAAMVANVMRDRVNPAGMRRARERINLEISMYDATPCCFRHTCTAVCRRTGTDHYNKIATCFTRNWSEYVLKWRDPIPQP